MPRKYSLKQIEHCQPGDILDVGTFAGIDPREPDQGPNTVNVRLADGLHYTESAGARVRVWDRVKRATHPASYACDCSDCRSARASASNPHGYVMRREEP